MRSAALACSAVLQLASAGIGAATGEPPLLFRDGDRVVFFGDSITHGGTYVYHLQAIYATRYPERSIAFENAGISGAELHSSLPRFDDDVLARKPNRVVACFGMNDVGRGLYATTTPDEACRHQRTAQIDGFLAANAMLQKRCAAAGIGLTLVSPPPFNQYRTAPGGEDRPACNDGLADLSAALQRFATAQTLPFLDIHTPMTAILKARPDYAYGDRIHPGGPGYLLIAYHFARAQGVRETVAQVEIDATKGRALAQDGCMISDLRADAAVLSFTYRATALPLPDSPDYREAARLCPLDDFNRETIRVRGLPAGRYALRIGDSSLGAFSHAELADGVDIARRDTPQQRQAQAIWQELARRAHDYEEPLRNRALMLYGLRAKGVDIADAAAVEREIDAAIAQGGYGGAVAASFRACQSDLAAIMRGREASLAALAQLRRIDPRPVAIRRVDPTQAITVVKATYGAGDQIRDVTDILRARIADGALAADASNALLSDPAPGVAKTLVVVASFAGREARFACPENGRLVIDRDSVLANAR